MTTQEKQLLHWLNKEIPACLSEFKSFEDFDKAMPSTCASPEWKTYAYAMAKERWKIATLDRIPR